MDSSELMKASGLKPTQRDAGMTETAILRPGDAVARFIMPLLTKTSRQ